jgi:hypothetical protein
VSPSVDVIYALHLKPGDWYAGTVDKQAPARAVQPFARAHRIAAVEAYTDDERRKWLAITAGPFTLTPVLAASQVLVIRHLEGSQS